MTDTATPTGDGGYVMGEGYEPEAEVATVESRPNPIPARVRGWLYVAGIIVGGFVAVLLPDVLKLLGADAWADVAVRACGALTALLGTLGRSNLSGP